jgi:hypothetical protein
LGFETLRPTLAEGVLQLPDSGEWAVLTHEEARSGWDMRVVPTYRAPVSYAEDAKAALGRATHVFWSSASQFDALKDRLSRPVEHACGPGKTAEHLARAGVKHTVFPSVEEWKKWINGA